MNIIKITEDEFTDAIIAVQKEYGISNNNSLEHNEAALLKLQRPENFIFNSYTIRFDSGAEYRVNRLDNTFKHYIFDLESLSFTLTRDSKGKFNPENISGEIPKLLAKRAMSNQEKLDRVAEGIMSVIIPVICFEHRIMQLMESRNVTVTDLSEVQTVIKSKQPGKKSKKNGKRPRVNKEVTLSFKDIERVVYSRPELPRTYTHHVESFDVSGHYRHYKSGKVVFVKGYVKGNKDVKPADKTYKIKL